VLNGHGGQRRSTARGCAWFREQTGNQHPHAFLLGCIHTGDREEVHGERQGAGATPANSKRRLRWPRFRSESIGKAVDYQKIKPLLHIKDPKSAADEEQFAKEAKLATTAKGEAMIDIAVKWTANQLREMIR